MRVSWEESVNLEEYVVANYEFIKKFDKKHDLDTLFKSTKEGTKILKENIN
ncbi:MAG: hypothetical protein Q8M92_06755 [Candidatus Subteraquimicrobiales bacterium]|nr:hypothetical protein [Candidatus Subteraquimicrobiales bacterium]